MMKQSFHQWVGWIATAVGLIMYGLLSSGWLPPTLFFWTVSAAASGLLAWALYIDRAYYGTTLQTILCIFNIIGAIRILLENR